MHTHTHINYLDWEIQPEIKFTRFFRCIFASLLLLLHRFRRIVKHTQANLHASNLRFYDVKFFSTHQISAARTKCNKKIKIKSDYGWHITMAIIIIWSCMLLLRNHRNIFIMSAALFMHAYQNMVCFACIACTHLPKCRTELPKILHSNQHILENVEFEMVQHTINRIMFSNCISGTTRCVCTLYNRINKMRRWRWRRVEQSNNYRPNCADCAKEQAKASHLVQWWHHIQKLQMRIHMQANVWKKNDKNTTA